MGAAGRPGEGRRHTPGSRSLRRAPSRTGAPLSRRGHLVGDNILLLRVNLPRAKQKYLVDLKVVQEEFTNKNKVPNKCDQQR